jgi:hypothetical protein
MGGKTSGAPVQVGSEEFGVQGATPGMVAS